MKVDVKEKVWTYEDYLKLEDDKRYEVINGRLVEMPAPGFEHQDILTELILKFKVFTKENTLGKVIPSPFDVILSESVVVQPDIVYISKENLKNIKEGRLFWAPDLVVEIVSPSTTRRDTVVKKGIYENFGVKEYWIVYPDEKAIEVWVLGEKGKEGYELYSFAEKKVKSKILGGLEVDLKEVF
ncbi:MAG: Uma2 family endonuclease [candidate division WOR-3 bacterium]